MNDEFFFDDASEVADDGSEEAGLHGALAAELASVEHSVPGGFGSVHQPELAERERRRPLLQDAAR